MVVTWKPVRLRVETVAALRALAEAWQRIGWHGIPCGVRCQWTEHVSLDAIVTELLRREVAKANRANKSKARKRAAKATESHDGPPVD